MKKLIVRASALVCILCLAGCSFGADASDIPDIKELGGLVTEKGYTQEEVLEDLSGQSHDSLRSAWGEPDGMLSGFWGDIWRLSEESNWQMIVYYDGNGCVENIKIVERHG